MGLGSRERHGYVATNGINLFQYIHVFIWIKINISELVEAPAKNQQDTSTADMDDAGDEDDETQTGYGSTYVSEISGFWA